MNSGGDMSGNGRNPVAPPPPSRPNSSSSASPSSSSSAMSAHGHLGFESIQQLQLQQQQQQQQQQHLAFRQSLQQQQQSQQHQHLRRAEVEDSLKAYHTGGMHGVIGRTNLPSSSSSMAMHQSQRKFDDALAQPMDENQSRAQVLSQQMQNPVHQAYLQFALQNAQQKYHGNLLAQQQGKVGLVGSTRRDQDVPMNTLKMQDLASLQVTNQAHATVFKRPGETFSHFEKQMEQCQTSVDQKSELKQPQMVTGQLTATNVTRPMQSLNSQPIMQNTSSSQMAIQLQAMQTWAQEHNIDLSHPSNLNLMTQFLPLWQQGRMAAFQKHNEPNMAASQSNLPSSKQQVLFSQGGNENTGQGNSFGELVTQGGTVNSQKTFTPASLINNGGSANESNLYNMQVQQQSLPLSRENINDKVVKHLTSVGNGGSMMQIPKSSSILKQSFDRLNADNTIMGSDALRMQHTKLEQGTQTMSPPAVTSSEDVTVQIPPQIGSMPMPHQSIGFTKPQLYVLKAQILAFRRLKRGEHALPPEVLQAIAPPPLDNQLRQVSPPSGMVTQERQALNSIEGLARHVQTDDKAPQLPSVRKGHSFPKDESTIEEKGVITCHSQLTTGVTSESARVASQVNAEQNNKSFVKSELQEVEKSSENVLTKGDNSVEKVKADAGQTEKPAPIANIALAKDALVRKYHGPLFDFPSFIKKNDLGSNTINYASNLALSYDAKDLLFDEGMDVLNKKRAENLRKINGLLAVNLERKRIRPDLVLKLQIEERKLRLLELQSHLRDKVDREQQEIMAMSDRPYRKFVKQCERQRIDLIRQVQQLQKASREKQLKSIFQWRKKLLESHWAIRDARTTRNRGVAKYHERMLREFTKRKDDDRNKRMEALKNNDVDRYREMLLEQQTNVPGDAAQRYVVLSSFLSQTEEYLLKLGGKITAAKNSQEMEEAANAAAAAARAQGFSEEEVKAAAACAGQEVLIRNKFSEMNAPKENSSVNKYYNLAHAVSERVVRQPSMLKTGTLRDYQLVGLQWMLSLYNNKLNGILADEMGLGKTVQVMALIAYLMEFKGNYGPHLIIVPNAVLVNWKSELLNWLPSLTCIFYVGGKDQRSKLFTHEVLSVKFNVLVTTYEFIMYDRAKLSKINWNYIIIDEAQRMKDRESVLARDLDRYRCQRRLLLTGTPLQNDLKELWSLLNLLLPEVFDNRKAFHDWFSKPFQRDGPSQNTEEDDWLETEKKVIIIHRLHQILEPFMLRRRVEDVEGSLPSKVSIVLRCRMSAMQSAIYDWIKSTGTIRVNPEEELLRVQRNPMYQIKMYKSLKNKCMELRKVCNHPLLNYPYYNDYSKDFLVRSCGKLWILDRILLKLHRSGHRVLLFSTMTKLLDIIEEYLQWRNLIYRRIDGTTSLEDREAAIVDFNSPNSDCFIFLLSIRAAGRGLNLQSADTVVIYDPDPNPQNEEQAVARAHRIGQKREVKVIYMEAVVDKITSFQREDEIRIGGGGDLDDELAGEDRYIGSIESLIRNNIQQYKIDMADEVINAGRFDQRTTHEERRMTLETLLHDEERYQETVHDVPSLQEVNRMIARSEEEVELFDQMDEEFDWTGDMVKYSQVPKWHCAGTKELNAVNASLSKKPSKNMLESNIHMDHTEIFFGSSLNKTERRGRLRGSSNAKSLSIYAEFDDEDGDDFDASSEDLLDDGEADGEGEIGELEEEELNGAIDAPPSNKEQSDEEGLICEDGIHNSSQIMEGNRSVNMTEEAGSTGSSSGSKKLMQPVTPFSSQKFGSLSALESRKCPPSKSTPDELEEGEIAVSGDSQMDLQQSGSWAHDREEGEEEQVLQPKFKRRRSIRIRPRNHVERLVEKSNNHRSFSEHGSQMLLQMNHDYDLQLRTDQDLDVFTEDRMDMSSASHKKRRNLPSRKAISVTKENSGKSAYGPGPSVPAEDATEHSRGSSWNGRAVSIASQNFIVSKMPDSTQRKCKNVISKLHRKVDKDGSQVFPVLCDFLRRKENYGFKNLVGKSSVLLDLQRIEQRVDNLEYNGVADFIADVQLMLKNVVQYCNYSHEVKCEAAMIHDLFFDIMKIAFPETDFREARNAHTFFSPAATGAAPSPRQPSLSQSRRLPQMETLPSSSPTKARGHTSAALQEDRQDFGPAHPADLVICKKRRNDRDKQRVGPSSPVTPRWMGSPLPPANQNRPSPARSPITNRSTRTPFQRDAHMVHPDGSPASGLSPGLKEVQWAKPVKKMRTDSGKRRPSHL
ncbi:hypothetical protein KFK09_018630 [Dendrobium nobile]|uniref:ATP-dependent helicase BRM n=1 Tax=Dendrobium nobile TaxID=94219 RepID=A0A8T3AWN1_DENNO|nr:hypothetical protein KFK09_018630 [Dendrobium nobile]